MSRRSATRNRPASVGVILTVRAKRGCQALVAGVALLVAGCSGGGGSHAGPTTTTTVRTTSTTPAAVSPRCRTAMRNLVGITGDLDPFTQGPPSGPGALAFSAAIARTLTRCESANEWLTAARDSGGRTPAGVTPEKMLAKWCGFRYTDRPRIIPLDAPSCVSAATARVISRLGACPRRYPSLPGSDTGVRGLDKELVPIAASVVRICRYDLPAGPGARVVPGGLRTAGVGVLTPPATAAFEAETNQLRRADASIDCPATRPPFFFLTFANDTARVDVYEENGCGFKTNGHIAVWTTTHWLNALKDYTTALTLSQPLSQIAP